MQSKIRKLSGLSLHPDYRWDSEYLSFELHRNKSLNYVPIGDVIYSQYGISIEMNEDRVGTKIYRMNEISNMMCERNILKYAPISHEEIETYKLKDKDVLFNRTNSQVFVGRTGIFRKFSEEDIVFASYLVRVNPDPEIITPEYLTAFLNTKYGVLDVKRRARISINQSNVNPEELKRVEIPLLCHELQTKITLSFDKAFHLIQASEAKYHQAQALLLSELGLADWQPKHCLTFVKNYSDVERAERIDAEYYQPKYEEIDKVLIKFNSKPIGSYDFLDITTGQYCASYVASNEGKPYLRGTDLVVGSVEVNNLVYIKEEDQIKSKRAQEGDVVVTRVGTIGLSARIPEECDGGAISDNLIRVRILDKNKIDSYYLSCFLGSIIGKSLMLRNARGSVQQRLNQETFKEISLPIPQMEVQAKIKHKVIESFNLRKQSKHLLECAKRAVEMAIEQDEQTAIDWLEDETNSLLH